MSMQDLRDRVGGTPAASARTACLKSARGGDDVVLEVRNLSTQFATKWGTVKAVDDVSYSVRRGETLGIVGESGSGKSVTALSLMRLVPSPAGAIVGGQVLLNGRDLLQLSEKEMTKVRGSEIAMILQDPMQALNPVFTIGNQVGETIAIHQDVKGAALRAKVVDVGPKSYTLELTGDKDKINGFIELLRPMGIKEIARTGTVAMKRETKLMKRGEEK